MALELKKRIRYFLRAPELALETARLRDACRRLYVERGRAEAERDGWKGRHDAEQARRKKADLHAEQARDYAASLVPEHLVEEMGRPEELRPGDRAIFIEPPALKVDIDLDQDPMELSHQAERVDLVPIHLRFFVNHRSPVPCGVPAKQLFRLIQKSIGEAMGQ